MDMIILLNHNWQACSGSREPDAKSEKKVAEYWRAGVALNSKALPCKLCTTPAYPLFRDLVMPGYFSMDPAAGAPV
jgi:hypothetical protein